MEPSSWCFDRRVECRFGECVAVVEDVTAGEEERRRLKIERLRAGGGDVVVVVGVVVVVSVLRWLPKRGMFADIHENLEVCCLERGW